MNARDRRKRRRRTVRASELVADVLAGYHIAEDVRARRVVTEWRRIVGDRIAAHTWPGRLSEGTLSVRVSSSSWLHELSFLKRDLIERIARALGDPPVVEDIRFYIARPRSNEAEDARTIRRAAARRARPLVPPARELPAPATGDRLAAIEGDAAAIEDPELRAIVVEARRKLDC